jgi:anaerobic magnesium-protoporphyrin IX monomethyl ester cyclase
MPWIALVGPEYEENLSLRYIASSLTAAGFSAEILAFNRDLDLPGIVAAIVGAKEPPLAVGLSLAFQWRAKDFLALAIALREAGYAGHVTAGGHFATFASKEILRDFPELDTICRQEAEDTLVSLGRALAAGEPYDTIAGLALRDARGEIVLTAQPALPDLARLPWPDRRGEPASCFGHAISPVVGSRGCYANCTFCCIAAWHEESQPGKRYRLREVDDIADEMVTMQRERGIEIFVFHDDNFFVPGHKKNVERFNALADALAARGIGRFATVVKARPTDADPVVFRILKERLHCIRVYIGVETDADQGLVTLGRWASSRANHQAIDLVRRLELFTCFNMLIFDPDTTVKSIETNLAFIKDAGDFPFNFGRVELYAGTPLLGRMQLEKRCWGDYMQWDYALGSPEVERIFELSMACFRERNFGEGALANRIMGTRFDIEVARHFHPEQFRPAWLDEGIALNRALADDTVAGLRAIVDHVKAVSDDEAGDAELVERVSLRLRETEAEIAERARGLARSIAAVVGGWPLTEIGDRVATPLQEARESVR